MAPERTVMRRDLAPVMASDGSGVPHELWRGLTVDGIEKLFAALEIPPRSPALHRLFRRLVTSEVPPPAGGASDPRFTALRVEALDRSGLIEAAGRMLAQDPATASDPTLSVLAARNAIATGDKDTACRNAQSVGAATAQLPVRLKGQAILIRAYCAVLAGQRHSAELQVALARDEGLTDVPGLDAIDAITSGAKPTIRKGEMAGVVDWRILEIAGPVDAASVLANATPGLLAVIARDDGTDPTLRLAAAESAARLNAIDAADLGDAYRRFQGGSGASQADASDDAGPGAMRRAALFQAAAAERTPLKKARLIRSFLDDAQRSGLYWPALQMIGPSISGMPRIPEIGWFTETAIESALASGNVDGARAWTAFGDSLDAPDATRREGYAHWQALADLTDPAPGQDLARNLVDLVEPAGRGRFAPEVLHKLATVLDALDIQVPIPLWDIASRTPQPSGGHLPETGVLSELADASKKQEFGRTVLLAMQALGPNGAEGAHIITLGDSIRALRRAGLESDARQLALEAVFAGWPRGRGS